MVLTVIVLMVRNGINSTNVVFNGIYGQLMVFMVINGIYSLINGTWYLWYD